MGIKEAISNFIAKRNEKDSKFKAMEQDYRFQKQIIQKEKSANERELERFHEERRQQQIKFALERERKRKDEDYKRQNCLKTPNVVAGGIQIMKTPNLFAGNRGNFR